MKIAITGPVNLNDLAPLLDAASAVQARNMGGLGGQPITGLVRGLLQHGHDVRVVTLARGWTGDAELHGARLSVAVGPFREARRARDAFRVERAYVAEALGRSRVDVIHAHWTYEFALGALAAKPPVLVTAHDAPLKVLWLHKDPYRLVRAGMALVVARRAQWMTAVSPYVAGHFRDALSANCPIAVVPGALAEEVFQAADTRCLCTGRPTVMTVLNGFDTLKNGARAIEAFATVRQQYPGAQLVMVGQGYEPAGAAASWAEQCGLAEGIEFAGPLAHATLLRRLAVEATVLLHPSLEESQSLVLCEAQALGVPVVAGCRSGAVPWTVEDGVTGLLVDVGSTSAIAAALTRLIDNPAECQALGAAGRVSARRRFGMAEMVAAYERIYLRMAA